MEAIRCRGAAKVSPSCPGTRLRAGRRLCRHAGATILLGQTAVDPDGSFFLQVPSERPIRFELLDGNAKTVRAAQTWFWMRRGEQRVCVGCHAGPERAPDNFAPAVLLRTTDPVKMCGNCHADKSGVPKATKQNLPVH